MSKCDVQFPEKKENNKIFITDEFLPTENHQNVNIWAKTFKFLLFVIFFIILIGGLSCLIHMEKSDFKIFLVVRKESIEVQKINGFTSIKNNSEKVSEIRNPIINIRIKPMNPQDVELHKLLNNEKIDEKNVEKGNSLGSDSLLIKTQKTESNIHETSEKNSEDILNPPFSIFNSGLLNRPLFDIFDRILSQKDDKKLTESQNIEGDKQIRIPLMRKVIFFSQRSDQENGKSPEKTNLIHFRNKEPEILPKSENSKSDSESEDSDDKIKTLDCQTNSESDETKETSGQMINNRRYVYQGPVLNGYFNPFNIDSDQSKDSEQRKDILRRFNSENSFKFPFSFRFKPANEESDNSQSYFSKSDSKDISESEDNLSSDESIATDNMKSKIKNLSIPIKSVEFGK